MEGCLSLPKAKYEVNIILDNTIQYKEADYMSRNAYKSMYLSLITTLTSQSDQTQNCVILYYVLYGNVQGLCNIDFPLD